MIDLINQVYFDKIRFILSNLAKLDLSDREVVVVLTILLLQEDVSIVSVESIINQTGLSITEVDEVVTLLAGKGFLEIEVKNSLVNFNVDNIFNLKSEANLDVSDIFKIFEEEFSRILTQKELVRLNEWQKKYSRDEIIEALRNASIMEKYNFNYINRILENNHES